MNVVCGINNIMGIFYDYVFFYGYGKTLTEEQANKLATTEGKKFLHKMDEKNYILALPSTYLQLGDSFNWDEIKQGFLEQKNVEKVILSTCKDSKCELTKYFAPPEEDQKLLTQVVSKYVCDEITNLSIGFYVGQLMTGSWSIPFTTVLTRLLKVK